MGKHLTLDDRLVIQIGLRQKESVAQIAKKLNVHRTTIQRELLKNSKIIEANRSTCSKWSKCHPALMCRNEDCFKRGQSCAYCIDCSLYCDDYVEKKCERRDKPPYVCNSCTVSQKCHLWKRYYETKAACEMSEKRLKETRRGIALTDEEFNLLNELVVKQAKRGHSFAEICRTFEDELPVSERTIYAYMEKGYFTMDRITLRRTVQRKYRKKSGPVKKSDKKCHIGRGYEEYQAYMEANPEKTVTELDSVVGCEGSRKVLLTMFIETCSVQLMILRERNTASSVSYAFDYLREVLGEEKYKKIFQVILCDRGSEFTDPQRMENDPRSGEQWCRVFYCDAMNSNQKSRCERNHQFIRYIVPKGKSFDKCTDEDIKEMMSHINSYPRKTLGWKAPIDLFIELYGEETATLLGLRKIEPSDVILNPSLIKK